MTIPAPEPIRPIAWEDAVKLQARGVEEIDASWERSLVVTTRFQLLVSAVLTLAAVILGYVILANIPIWAFLALIAWIAFSTLVLAWLSTRATRRTIEDRLYLRVGLVVSILTVTLANYLIGQAEGDFYLIYFLPLITAGVYFGIPGSLITALVSGISYVVLAYLTVAITPLLAQTLGVRIAFFFLIASAIGLLTEGQRYLLQVLRQACRDATHLALVDSLTGIHNRRYLIIRLTEEVAELKRYGDSVALLMIDVDHFKAYNDRHGHLAGDEALRVIARLLREACRSADIVGRFGGDEFAAVLPHTTSDQAVALGQRIRESVAASFSGADPLTALTLTVGVAAAPEHAETPEELFVRSDEALYQAKQVGRNAVQAWSPGAELGTARPSIASF